MRAAILVFAVMALAACNPSDGGEPPCAEQECQPQPDPALG